MHERSNEWVVIKLGGTSVSRARWWNKAAEALRDHRERQRRVLVVHSALAGVTDLLEAMLNADDEDSRERILGTLRERHAVLANEMGVSMEGVEPHLANVRRLATGAALTKEITPRLRATVLAAGELMASELSHRYLAKCGIDVSWQDARTLLVSRRTGEGGARHYLSAVCDSAFDPSLRERLERLSPVVLTQGFIASDVQGDTVLLGRGGSDISGAIFAARLAAESLEIWTDVPGMFSANPRSIPAARLLRRLDYTEAQEIAGTGAKVLHPRCISPLRRAGVPLRIRYTPDPALPGTEVLEGAPSAAGRVKAVSLRHGITLVEMETSGMWQQVGFLADAFAVFRQHGLSVDLVSTSETNVTVSLDPLANTLDERVLEGLLEDLSRLCRPRLIENCAAVSLVGQRMRANLHRLAPVLELFDERRVHLVSQSANDLNFTVVVDDADAERLTRELHALVIRADAEDETFGPSWDALFPGSGTINTRPAWWRTCRNELLAEAARGTPRYVYHRATLDDAAMKLAALPVDRVFFAVKANPHPAILARLRGHGIGFECVSPGEIRQVIAHVPGVQADEFLFTPNFAPREDYAFALEQGIRTTLDNLHALECWPELFRDREILLRLDPGQGAGHHRHVRTAGTHSKFGIPLGELETAATLARAAGARVIGLHAHVGSGVRDGAAWAELAGRLAQAASFFPEVRILDLGGGLGVPEREGDAPLDMQALAHSLQRFRDAEPGYRLWIEPGRYLVAESGVLLARVTQLKGKGATRYVGVDAGMHTLIRPALYGAHHDIVNLSCLDEPAMMTADVVGPICESGDVLGRERRLPTCREGDVILLATAGAYGRAMSSEYNLRGLPEESML